MLRRRHDDDDDDDDRIPRGPSRWSTRLAWATLVGGAVLLVARVSVATIVQVHGEGMAPSLQEGDYVLLLRDHRSIARGDIIVYDPLEALGPGPVSWLPSPDGDAHHAPNDEGDELPDVRKPPDDDFRNTAVVDREELEKNWRKVQRKSDGIATRERVPMRIGRVLAVPGDRVSFNVDGATLGLAVRDEPIIAKPGNTHCEDDPCPPIAFETTDERRYPVLPSSLPERWPGLSIPRETVTTEAPGFLVVADNRDEGACCDSRALGWIPREAVRGRIVMRLSADSRTGSQRPRGGLMWKP